MTFFEPEQVRFVRFLDGDRAGYVVELPGISYDGRVIVHGAREQILAEPEVIARWVVDQLEVMAVKLGYNVTCGRMASPVDLGRYAPGTTEGPELYGPRPS